MEQQGTILIVEDELGPRESLRMILKPIYRVHTATNGQEALEFIRNTHERVDLVTLDLKMPGIPGIDVLKEIKKDWNDIEVIIVTGYGTLTNAVEAIRYGAMDFISKPFNVAEIISIVRKSIERRNSNLKIKNFLQKLEAIPLWENEEQANIPPLSMAGGNFIAETNEFKKELKETLQQLQSFQGHKVSANYLDFFKVLIYILESKETYTNGHSERVASYAELIVQDLNLSQKEKEDLQIAALLHDIGKIGISNRLLKKVSLNQNDWLYIRQHPVKGVYLVEPLAFSHAITSAIRFHHERWAGKGYPDGVSGEEIPLLARIIALADSYDAMTSERPYRPHFPIKKVVEEIEKNAGVQFDPQLVPMFIKHLKMGEYLPRSFKEPAYPEKRGLGAGDEI